MAGVGLIVQKYGGSSLATPKHIQAAARRVKLLKQAGNSVVVVVSAMGHTTDHLIKLARKTVAAPPQRELDMLLTAGERVSMSLLAMALHAEGVPAISFTGSQSGIVTTNDHTEAKIIDIRAHRIREELEKDKVVIVAGFQGVSLQKEITTLGRGGSDTTAVAIAAFLGANKCEILTDVDGIFTADPRIVAKARLIASCSYDECLELASLGAKMHPRSIELAKKFKVPLRIASSASLDEGGGTRLTEEKTVEQTAVRGIATKTGFHYFRAEVALAEALALLGQARVAIRFFTHSPREIRFLVDEDRHAAVVTALKTRNVKFDEVPRVAVVSAVGEGLCHSPEVLPVVAAAVCEEGAECLMLLHNSLSINAVVSLDQKDRLTRRLHELLLPPT